ncbi:MAG: energy-coupling factor transporter transmembrane protein EcfT [Actinomycetes bacterium]
MNPIVGSYRERNTPMHRLPAWVKLPLLVGWTVVSIIVTDPVSAVGMAVAAILVLLSILPPVRPTVRAMLGLSVVAVIAGAYAAWRIDLSEAIDTTADFIGLFALSLAITGSTRMGDMLDLFTRMARPFRRVVPPAIPGLMFSIVVRVIPEVAQILAQSREALKARGIERSLRGTVTPTAIRTVGFALDLGQALHARGIADDAVPERGRREQALAR